MHRFFRPKSIILLNPNSVNTGLMKFIANRLKGKYKVFNKGLSIEFGKFVDVSNMEIEEANNYIRNEVLKILRK